MVERSGVVNIGIEGMILCGALGAALANIRYGPIAGLVGAIAVASLLGLVFAFVTLLLSADQIVTGTGINLLALGVTGLVYKRWPEIGSGAGVYQLSPYWMTLTAALLALVLAVFFRRTRPGLRVMALGHAPQAADSAGIPVVRYRLLCVMFGAACAGLAGAYLATMRTRGFNDRLTVGQGFLALAMVIFGRWSVGGVVLAALFFGLMRGLADLLGLMPHFAGATQELLEMIPYAASLLALALLAGKSRAPAALGKAYERA